MRAAIWRAAVYLVPLVAVLGLGGTRTPILAACLGLVGAGVIATAGDRGSGRLGVAGVTLSAVTVWQLITTVHLPAGLIEAIAPAGAAMVRLGTEAAGVAWSGAPLSLAPGDTALAVARTGLVAAVILWTCVDRSPEHRAAIHRALVLLAAALVAVVAAHWVTGVDLIYGMVPAIGLGFSPILSPFGNANDLAGVAVALVPVLFVDATRFPAYLRAGSTVLVAAMGLIAMLTLSRSATLGLGLGALTLFGILLAAGVRRLALGMAAAGLGAAALLGVTSMVDRRAALLVDGAGLVEFGGRGLVWGEALRMAQEYGPLGVGAQAFGTVWWSIRERATLVHAQDAEGLIPQCAATFGVPLTIALTILGIATVLRVLVGATRRARQGDILPAGAAAGLVALLGTAMFSLTTAQPGIAVLAAYLLALTGVEPRWGRKPLALGLALVMLAVASVGLLRSLGGTLDETDAWFSERLLEGLRDGDDPVEVALRHPADPYGYAWSGALLARRNPQRALVLVNRSMVLDRHGAEPHRAATVVLLANGLRDQAIGEISLALAVATPDERARMVRDALDLFPERADRLRIVPRPAEAAVEVAREFGAQGGPELARATWLHLATRHPPPLAAVRVLLSSPGAMQPAELIALCRRAVDESSEPAMSVLLADALLRVEPESSDAIALLRQALSSQSLPDLWRGAAVELLGHAAVLGALSFDDVLALPTDGGRSETALRDWVHAEQLLAAGKRSQGLRALSAAARARPDLVRLQQRLAAVRDDL